MSSKSRIITLKAKDTLTLPQPIQDLQVNNATVTFHLTVLKVKRGKVTFEVDSPVFEGDVTIVPNLGQTEWS